MTSARTTVRAIIAGESRVFDNPDEFLGRMVEAEFRFVVEVRSVRVASEGFITSELNLFD